MERLTCKIFSQEYLPNKMFLTEHDEVLALRQKLGKYEDLGYSPEELENIIQQLYKLNLIIDDLYGE